MDRGLVHNNSSRDMYPSWKEGSINLEGLESRQRATLAFAGFFPAKPAVARLVEILYVLLLTS